MLDDCNGWFIEVVGGTKRGIGINVVVVRHLFATKLARLSNSSDSVFTNRTIKRRGLVRVLTVAKHVGKLRINLEARAKAWVCVFNVTLLTGGALPVAL